jgi:hypothetical protein
MFYYTRNNTKMMHRCNFSPKLRLDCCDTKKHISVGTFFTKGAEQDMNFQWYTWLALEDGSSDPDILLDLLPEMNLAAFVIRVIFLAVSGVIAAFNCGNRCE